MVWGKFRSAIQIGMMAIGLIAAGGIPAWVHDADIGILADPILMNGTGAGIPIESEHPDWTKRLC